MRHQSNHRFVSSPGRRSRLVVVGTLLLCIVLLAGTLPLAPAGHAQPAGLSRSIRRPADSPLPQGGIQKTGPADAVEAQALGWRDAQLDPRQPEAEAITYPDGTTATDPPVPFDRWKVTPAQPEIAQQMRVRPEYLQFARTAVGLLPASQLLTIFSSTGATVNFTIAEDIPWLSVAEASGSAGTTPFTAHVSVNASGLAPANSPYTGDIVITDQANPAEVHKVRARLALTDEFALATLTSFDGNGNLQRRIKPDGSMVDYDYDELGRLAAMHYPNGSSVAYTYDGNGNRTSMTDAFGTTYYTYDMWNRLTAVYYPGLNPVRYAYDTADNLVSMTYPDNRVITYTYDADNRMTSVADGTGTTTYSYNPVTGWLASQTLPNGVTTSYSYDGDGRLTDVMHRKADNTLLMAFHYSLDANGMRTAVMKQTPTDTETTGYTYDDLLRLNQATYPDGRIVTYTYDALGNRLSLQDSVNGTIYYTYDSDNRLVRAGDELLEYDANGNIVRRTSPNKTILYTWDYDNRLVRYEDGQHVVEFEYDGDGNRVAKIVDGVRTNYLVDVSGPISQVLLTTDSDWYVEQEFVFGLDRVGLNQWGVANWQYYLHDSPLRNVRGLTNSAGALARSFNYDAFGALIDAVGIATQPYQYNGEEVDAETGLIHLRHRYYDPTLGRFLTRDTFPGWTRQPKTTHPYAYVHNDPVNFIDPTGDLALVDTLIGAGIGGALALVGTYAGDVVSNFAEGQGWRSFKSSSSWETYVGNTAGGAAAGAMITINPFAAGAAGGAAGNLVTQGLSNLTGRSHGMDAGSLATDTVLGGVFSGAANAAIARGPGRPAEKIATKLFGTISQRVNWGRGAIEEALGVGWGGAAHYFADGTWSIDTKDLGGVALNKTAELMLQIDDLTGATYDPATGQIVLYGNEDVALPQMDMNDLAVAVHSVFGGNDPGVSIDPPLVNNNFSVRYVGETRQTEFGWIMFESDRVMKILSLGRDNITGQPVTSSVPGYKSMLQRELESGTCTPGEGSTRFWFQPKEVKLVRSTDGISMVFDAVSMEVLTESMFQGGTVDDPEAEAFAAHFTQHYDDFAQEWPILKDLKRLAKVVAVIKWIRDNDLPIDLGFVDNYTIEYFSTPDTTPATTVQGSNGTCQITITGGVSYQPPNEYLPDDPVSPVTNAMAEAALGQRPSENDFLWDFQPPPQAVAAGIAGITEQTQTAVAETFARSRKNGNISFVEVDLSYPVESAFTLDLTRYYDSFSDQTDGFGLGWRELPFELRFPEEKRTFTFGSGGTSMELYEAIWVAERPASREDLYRLLGLANNGLPLYKRSGSQDILWALSDGTFVLAKAQDTEITFDTTGRVTSLADRNENVIQYIYNGSGRLMRIAGPGDRAIVLGYNVGGRVTQASGPGARTVTYGYDAAGNLATVTDFAGQTRSYGYDANHCLVSAVDAEGNPVFSASYDDYDRATEGQLGTAAAFAQSFDLKERRTNTTDPYGEQNQQHFDNSYRVVQTIDPLSNQVDIAYAGDFGPQFITDTHGVVTQLVYDQYGNLSVTFDGDGARTDLWHDGYHRLGATRDPEGIETAFGYDSNHNLTTIYHHVQLIFDPSGNLTGWYYNPINVTRFGYAVTGTLETITNPRNYTTQFGYDAYGQLTASSTPSGIATSLAYDSRSRLDSLRAGGSQIDFSYDNADNLTGIAAAAGNVGLSHDAAGNLVGIADAVGNSTGFTYDGDGNLSQVQDAGGNHTDYAYDVVGNLNEVALPNDSSTAYEYDELGRIAIAYTGPVAQRTYPLVSGWTLVGLDVVPIQPLDAEAALDDIAAQGGDATEVNRWLNGGWDAHIRNLPFNNFSLGLGQGYFFRSNAVGTWRRIGLPLINPLPLRLVAGWNLVSFPKLMGLLYAEDLLNGIAAQGGACSEVNRWLNGGWDAHIGGLPFNNFTVAPDKGYFVKCSQSSIFVPGTVAVANAQPDQSPPAKIAPLAPTPNPKVGDVLVTNRRDVALTVTWRTDQPSDGWVEYGTTPDLGQAAYDDRGDKAISAIHYVTLAELQPETTVFFRIHSGDTVLDQQGKPFETTTLATSAPGEPVTVYGQVMLADNAPAVGALVIVRLVGSADTESELLATVVDGWGYWTLSVAEKACRAGLQIEVVSPTGARSDFSLPGCKPGVVLRLGQS